MLTAEETTTLLLSERLALTAYLATVARDYQAAFDLYRSPEPILSLGDLEGSPLIRTSIRGGFRTLAVGIDLSGMGFAEGESTRDLFIQDAADDDQRVDPVMIIGLPHGVSE